MRDIESLIFDLALATGAEMEARRESAEATARLEEAVRVRSAVRDRLDRAIAARIDVFGNNAGLVA